MKKANGELTDSIPICVWTAGREGRIESCNRAWRQYAGAGAGVDFCAAVPETEREQMDRAFWGAVRSARPIDWEQRLRRHDGKLRWHLFRIVPDLDESDTLLGFVITATDIDARKQVEVAHQSLLAAETELRKVAESASSAKDEFLAILSHELRTPLGAILGWTRILRDRGGNHDSLERALETIDRSARTQAKLLEDIFDVCRIASGKLRVDIRRMDLHQVIRDAVDLVQPAADAKAVTLQMSLEPESGDLPGDPDRLQQVVWNLLANAIKFTPRGGRVSVQARRDHSQVVIEVRDTGIGIARDFLPHVFDRFRQADESGQRRQGGLGLGLAIVRHVVQMHGGMVCASSDGDAKGSTFTVRLPLPDLAGAAHQVHDTIAERHPDQRRFELGDAEQHCRLVPPLRNCVQSSPRSAA